MFFKLAGDIIILLGLGLVGWFILARLRIPAAEILGPVVVIGAMRAFQVDLPVSPAFLFPIAQIIIGIFVGSMLTRETVRELKPMTLSVLVIVVWALSIIFLIGFFLDNYTVLDLYTAMLSASMGGLPEITIIALASGAGITVIVVTQMLRLLVTVLIFPLILNRIEKNANRKNTINIDPGQHATSCASVTLTAENIATKSSNASLFNRSWTRVLFTVALASTGGLLLEYLGVPAGLLVGSSLFIAAASIAGAQISRLSPRLFDLLLVFIGITIADNISIETITTIGDRELLVPILIATSVIFGTSFIVSSIICRLTGWDYPTCFLAAAPGGFTMMTALAVKHGLDPLKVSMLHLCRLLAINMFLPFLFMFLMNR